jgi:voltage-gated potassium channel
LTIASLRTSLQELYEGNTRSAHGFRYTLLAFDLLTVVFVITTSFLPRLPFIGVIDGVFGALILADLLARLISSRQRLRVLFNPASAADFAAMLSFLAPIAGEGFAFLRILRTVRLLHTYQVLARLRSDFAYFRRNEEALIALANLCVFLFVMTGVVFETQHRQNDQIANYADALYFTVTTLTTTGFGDITLTGTAGRLISVVVMIVGVTLFLRLAQVLFRPTKVRHECPVCGLLRHDPDAVHCKHCGTTLHIETEGMD